jgi:hypothetical protein
MSIVFLLAIEIKILAIGNRQQIQRRLKSVFPMAFQKMVISDNVPTIGMANVIRFQE